MTPAMTRSPADVLPLRRVDLLVLPMLAVANVYGYGIMQESWAIRRAERSSS
jgi:hypothetical protein